MNCNYFNAYSLFNPHYAVENTNLQFLLNKFDWKKLLNP